MVWERIAPVHPDQTDWTWTDERLHFFKEKGMEPIVGLLHHGSGPHYCTFDQDHFPEQLAQFARRVAERYPWLTLYNPVNEPLTTARFAGLYGHWYPHQTDDASFCRILFNECKGIVLAMQEIRKIQPAARLIQTEDLGMTHSTSKLQYQADFENERRWLGYDLLCGRVNEKHTLWKYLLKNGVTAEELHFFTENPCPPDVLGLDYYLTSERYLDHETDNYPASMVGGNGRHVYVDIEAVRAPVTMAGAENLLLETWERYHIPLAVTEVHLGCSREEQMRWLYQAWQTGKSLRARGVDFRAITAWAILGSFDWNTLLTREVGYYEPGLFDVRSVIPRPTALASLVKQLLSEEAAVHPVACEVGWWQKEQSKSSSCISSPKSSLLIFTDNQALQTAFSEICTVRGLAYQMMPTRHLNNTAQLLELVKTTKPWAIILASEARSKVHLNLLISHVDENLFEVTHLVHVCQQTNTPLLAFSDDFVFDGTKGVPYTELDRVCPPCAVSEGRVAAENLIQQCLSQSLIVRTGALLNPWHAKGFIQSSLQKFAQREDFDIPDHVRFSPAYLPEVIHHSLDLLLDNAYGLWHLSNTGDLSWAEFTKRIAWQAGLSKGQIEDWYQRQKERSFEKSFLSTALASHKAVLMSDVDTAMHTYWQASAKHYSFD